METSLSSAKPSISFFCPAYNDQDNLPRLIPEVVKVLREVANQFEIVIIEDGSPDRTGAVAETLAKQYPNIRVFHHERNLGYGAALVHGFTEAKSHEWVWTTDGDMQYDPKELKLCLPYMNDYDAVVGYRLSRKLNRHRMLQTMVYNFLIRSLFGLKIKDINCSFKLVKRAVLDKFELKSQSSFIDAELLIKLRAHGAKVMEIPVNHFPRLHGQAAGAKPKVVLTTIKEMLTYFFIHDLKEHDRPLHQAL